MKTTVHSVFCCEKCGSSHFGSSRETMDGPIMRQCHASSRTVCGHTFPESDDYKNFKAVTTISFESQAEFEKWDKEYRKTLSGMGTTDRSYSQ